ncbi:MAG TPA: hypothetical protein VGF14_07780 [Alphaproteobacteria bacterium]
MTKKEKLRMHRKADNAKKARLQAALQNKNTVVEPCEQICSQYYFTYDICHFQDDRKVALFTSYTQTGENIRSNGLFGSYELKCGKPTLTVVGKIPSTLNTMETAQQLAVVLHDIDPQIGNDAQQRTALKVQKADPDLAGIALYAVGMKNMFHQPVKNGNDFPVKSAMKLLLS